MRIFKALAAVAALTLALAATPALADMINLSLDFGDPSWSGAGNQTSYSRTYNSGTAGELGVTLTARSWGHDHFGRQVDYNAKITQHGGGLGVKDIAGPGSGHLIDDNTFRHGNRVEESIEVSFSKPVDINSFWVGDFFQEQNLFGHVTGWEAGKFIAYDADGNIIYDMSFNAGQISPGDPGYLGYGRRLYDDSTLGVNLSNISSIAFFADSDNMNPGSWQILGGIGDKSNFSLGGLNVSYDKSAEPTPEPATVLLLASGLFGAVVLRRRRS